MVVERLRVGVEHGHTRGRDRPADETGREPAIAELPLERRFAQPRGVRAEEDGGEVRGGYDGEGGNAICEANSPAVGSPEPLDGPNVVAGKNTCG